MQRANHGVHAVHEPGEKHRLGHLHADMLAGHAAPRDVVEDAAGQIPSRELHG